MCGGGEPRYPGAMRCPSSRPWLAVALVLGALAGCYQDDFLLGAYCKRDTDCGADQCCSGPRCRPQGDDCNRSPGEKVPFPPAYRACTGVDECLAHGMPRCVRWADASVGFCTDDCIYSDVTLCELHTDVSATRVCVEVDGTSTCAIACNSARLCPTAMTCVADLCVPMVAP